MKYKVTKKQNNSKSCLVCGMQNEVGLKGLFYELENGVLVGVINPKKEHQSYPGVVHGGISASLLDEIIGRAIQISNPNMWGMTVELTTNYHLPVPLGAKLKVISKIIKENRFFFEGYGEILLPDDQVAVSGYARYIKSDIDKIVGDNTHFLAEEWFNVPDIVEVKEIEIAEERIISLLSKAGLDTK